MDNFQKREIVNYLKYEGKVSIEEESKVKEGIDYKYRYTMLYKKHSKSFFLSKPELQL